MILNQVPNYGSKLRNDLLRGIPRVWTNYFMLDKDKDVAFEVGRFYYGTREYAKALEFYRISSESIGEHHVTAHNMGLCYYSMSKFPEALECFSKSLGLNKDYEKAASWRAKVRISPPSYAILPPLLSPLAPLFCTTRWKKSSRSRIAARHRRLRPLIFY